MHLVGFIIRMKLVVSIFNLEFKSCIMLICILLNWVHLLCRGASIVRYEKEAFQWFLCCSTQCILACRGICPKSDFAQWCNMALVHLLEHN